MSLSAAARGGTLQVQGLAELQRDLNKVNKTAKAEVRNGLKSVGLIVAEEAQLIAKAKGLVGDKPHGNYTTGQLVAKIKPSVRQQGVFVRAGATRNGYPYPAIYEYGTKRGRPFLEPALARKEKDVERAMEHWLDSFLSGNNL